MREEREDGHAEILMYDYFHVHIMLNRSYHNIQLYA